MSRLAGLFVLLLAGAAFADTVSHSNPSETEAPTPAVKAPKVSHVPLRIVKILADSEQALLFDKHRGRHVLVEVGEAIGDYVVEAIDEEEVTLSGKDAAMVVLVAPSTGHDARREAHASAVKPAASKPASTPVDPYGAEVAPADPYDDEPVREASAAGIDPGAEPPIRATVWGAPEPAAPAPTTVPATPAAPAPGTAPVPAPASPVTGPVATPTATATNTATLTRKEVTAALANFGTLVGAIDASFTGSGLAIAKVRPASVFAKAGLASGDVITAVDGKPLRSLDDAADLYARAGSIKAATVDVVRDGKPQTLRITIH